MAAQSSLEALPAELVYHILSYLIHPRSRLSGLTERQSDHDYPIEEKKAAKEAYHLDPTAAPDDSDPYVMRIFQWKGYPHPFNALALTSRRLRAFVEAYCAHLVTECNRFNLQMLQAAKNGPKAVYPDMSDIVYRRLWLQYAPRHCIFCNIMIGRYPYFEPVPVVCACQDCFVSQIYVSQTS